MSDFWRVFDGSVGYRDDGLWGRSRQTPRVAVGGLVLAVGVGAVPLPVDLAGGHAAEPGDRGTAAVA